MKDLFNIMEWFGVEIAIGIWYKVKYFFINLKEIYWEKIHLIDCRSKEYGYKGGYTDSSTLIFLASFSILKDYVEKSAAFKYVYDIDNPPVSFEEYKASWPGWDEELIKTSYDSDIKQFRDGVEIKTIYDWWVNIRPKDHEAHNDLYNKWSEKYPSRHSWLSDSVNRTPYEDPMYLQYRQEQQRLWEKDDEMFNRLMKVRLQLFC